MRFWHWLFRRRAPKRADARTSPYRTAPDKLPGAPPPPPPEERTSLPEPPRPLPARRRPAQGSSNWGLLVGIVGLVGKLVNLGASPSPSTYRPPPIHVPPASTMTWALGNEAPAWQAPEWIVPPLKSATVTHPPLTASATAKLSPAATSTPTRSNGASPAITKPLTPAQPARAH